MRQVINKETGEIREFTEEAFIEERDRLLLAWQKSKEDLETAKANEIDLRKQCVDFAFDPNKQSGTERIELGGGFQAKAVKKVTYGFIKGEDGKTDRKAIEKALSKIEADSAAGEFIAERLVKWSPELSLTEYNKLDERTRKIIDAVIVTSDGAPTLEIIEPKAKK